MKFLRQSLNILLLVGTIVGVHGQKCGRYFQDGGVCANYMSNDDYVVYAEGQDILNIEKSLQPLAIAQGLSTLRSNDTFLGDCVQAFTSLICSSAFPKCNIASDSGGTLIPPCKSTCTKVLDSCNLGKMPEDTQKIVKGYIQSSPFFPQNCDGTISKSPPLNINYPTENCNSSPQLSIKPKCFSPLIEDPKWVITNKALVTDERFCQGGCCLPCPQSYGLYRPNELRNGFFVTQLLRAFSAVGSGIMLISYMVLPGKRTHPSILILFASLMIFLYSSNVFFSIGNPRAVQCVDEVIPSTQSNKPFACGFQGALLIFASHATAMWIGAIILSLHIHTVWNSNIMGKKYIYIHSICWGFPALLTIIAVGKRSISYQFATLCLVNLKDSNVIFFYPLAIIVIPSFFLHMATFIHIFKVSRQDEPKVSQNTSTGSEFMTHRRHVLQAIKIQWRALLLAIILLTTVMFYWLFYFIELGTLADGIDNTSFKIEWTTCIQSGQGQDFCAKNVTKKHMPRFGLIFTAEAATSLIGIYLIAIFSNLALWQEWAQWFGEKFHLRHKEEEQDQFFAI